MNEQVRIAEAVIVSTARTPIGKAYRGALNNTYGATLGAHAVRAAVKRAGIEPAEVQDVVVGGSLQEGTTGWNVARQVALRAGLPVTVPGMTINRFCSTGLQTIAIAAQQVVTGQNRVVVAGGVESISLVQNEQFNQYYANDPWLVEHKPEIFMTMLETAEVVAECYGVGREAQDEYSLESQRPHCGCARERPLRRGDRPDHNNQESRRQRDRRGVLRGGHAQHRRVQPPEHNRGRPGEPDACA